METMELLENCKAYVQEHGYNPSLYRPSASAGECCFIGTAHLLAEDLDVRDAALDVLDAVVFALTKEEEEAAKYIANLTMGRDVTGTSHGRRAEVLSKRWRHMTFEVRQALAVELLDSAIEHAQRSIAPVDDRELVLA